MKSSGAFMEISHLLDTSESFSEAEHILWEDYIHLMGPDQIERDVVNNLESIVETAKEVVQEPLIPQRLLENAVEGARESSFLFFSSCTARDKTRSVRPYSTNRKDVMSSRVQMYLKRAKACCRSLESKSVPIPDLFDSASCSTENVLNDVTNRDGDDDNDLIDCKPADVYPSSQRITIHPVYELSVRLLSTRNISSTFIDDTESNFELEAQLFDEEGRKILQKESKQLETTRSSLTKHIDWNTSLNIRLRSAEAQFVARKQNIKVALYFRSCLTSNSSNLIGHIDIPIDLGEVFNAHSISRWFPFHIESSNDSVQGEIRLGLLISPTEQENEDFKKDIIQESKESSEVSLVSEIADEKCTQPIAFGTQPCVHTIRKDPLRATKVNVSKDVRKSARSRMQVFSPPSSQSADSQSDSEELLGYNQHGDAVSVIACSNHKLESRVPRKLPMKSRNKRNCKLDLSTVTSSRLSSQPKRIPPTALNVKPFLRRKNQQVASRKLDWSNIPSRTDSFHTSNLQTRSRKGILGPDKMQNLLQELKSMMEFVDSVCVEVYQVCGVTPETASMAHIKYKAERRNILQSIIPSSRRKDASYDLLDDRKKATRLLDSIWTMLAADCSGQLYTDVVRESL
uniref:AlNc14C216G9018 protein n=1 Tax=Albugo laibachii Nc14 TaxID=890382 RepID=F0WRL7_9STRA|nr:AlNc14C216G9018 [Albugo laibachii Nc14]|eukprot:CCA23981.1 AlNc14C216G9018 [Albugo laibachii Nc14]